MVWYYCGLAFVTAVVLIMVTVSFLDLYSIRDDKLLESRMMAVSQKIESSVSNTGKIPASLDEVALEGEDTSGMTYQPVSSNKYALCGTFKKASRFASFDKQYDANIQSEALKANNNLPTDVSYFAANNGSAHDAGFNCIVYEPYMLSDTYKSQYVCGDIKTTAIYSMQKYGPVQLEAISPETRVLTTRMPIYYVEQVSQSAKYFNASCQPIESSQVMPGEYIYFYKMYGGNVEIIQATGDRP
jgi:hypothetical protein